MNGGSELLPNRRRFFLLDSFIVELSRTLLALESYIWPKILHLISDFEIVVGRHNLT